MRFKGRPYYLPHQKSAQVEHLQETTQDTISQVVNRQDSAVLSTSLKKTKFLNATAKPTSSHADDVFIKSLHREHIMPTMRGT